MTKKSFNYAAWDMFWAGLMCGCALKDVLAQQYWSAGVAVVGMVLIMLISSMRR